MNHSKGSIRISLIMMLSLTLTTLYSQSTDSLYIRLKNSSTVSEKAAALSSLSFRLSLIKPDSSLLLAGQALALLNTDKEDETLASCYSSLGWAYYKMGKLDSAKFRLKKSIDIYGRLKIYKYQANVLLNLSSLYQTEGNYAEVLKCLLQAQAVSANLNNKGTEAYIEKMLGITYREQGQYDKAMISLKRAIDKSSQGGLDMVKADALGSLGSLFYKTGKVDSALVYYKMALDICSKNDLKQSEAFGHENIGDAFGLKGEQTNNRQWYDSSLAAYMKAYAIFSTLGSEQDIAYEKMKIGMALYNLKRYKESLEYLNHALAVFDSAAMYNYSYDALGIMSKAYKEYGDFRNASQCYERMLVYNDTLNNRSKNELIASMLAKYETEKKDREIELLNVKNSLAEKEVSRFKTIGVFSVISVILLLALAFMLLARYRTKEELKEARIRNQLAADLHDDIGSSLSSILLLVNMAGETSSKGKESYFLGKIGENTREIIDKINEIVWTINPKFDEALGLADRIESHAESIKQITGLDIRLHIDDSVGQQKLNMNIRKNLYLIFKEAMNNIVKHARAARVDIELQLKEQEIRMLITDDGIGFDPLHTATGNGMQTMVMRAEACNGSANIVSENGKGTTIAVTVPFTHSRYKKD